MPSGKARFSGGRIFLSTKVFHCMQTGNTFFFFFSLFFLLGFVSNIGYLKFVTIITNRIYANPFRYQGVFYNISPGLGRPKDRLFALHSLSPHTVILGNASSCQCLLNTRMRQVTQVDFAADTSRSWPGLSIIKPMQ